MATFDLSDDISKGIKSGTVKFAIDQQPYLQGYIPVAVLATMLVPGQVLLLPNYEEGKVLTGLVKRIDKSLDVRAIGTPAEMESALTEWSQA